MACRWQLQLVTHRHNEATCSKQPGSISSYEMSSTRRLITQRIRSRSLAERPVMPQMEPDELRGRLGGPVPEGPTERERRGSRVGRHRQCRSRGDSGAPGLGFVIGGASPRPSLAADWLSSTWDQNPGSVCRRSGSVGGRGDRRRMARRPPAPPARRVGGDRHGHADGAIQSTMAAARNHVLTERGWDVEERGLRGARDPATPCAGVKAHWTFPARAVRFIGLGLELDRAHPGGRAGQSESRRARQGGRRIRIRIGERQSEQQV